MQPIIAQDFVAHRQAALLHQAEQSRLAAQARSVRTGRSMRGRATTLATQIRGLRFRGLGAEAPMVAEAVQGQRPAAPAGDPTPVGRAALARAEGPIASPSRRPASWARARVVAFGSSGRTLSGPSDVTPPSPAL